MIVRHQLRRQPPALFHRRAAGQPLQAVPVERTHAALHRVALRRDDQHVPRLRVHQTVHRLSVDQDAAADARAHREIEHVPGALSRAQAVFRQCGDVGRRVDRHGHMECLPEHRQQRIVPPLRLGRTGDAAVRRRGRIQIQRPERADAQRLHVKRPDKLHDLRNRCLRRSRRKAGALHHAALRIANRCGHVRAARLKRSNEHESPPPSQSSRIVRPACAHTVCAS